MMKKPTLLERDIKKFLKRTILSPGGALDGGRNAGVMQRRVPDEFVTEKMRQERLLDLVLVGEEFVGFKKIFSQLRADPRTEYLKDRDLEERFWYLFCQIYFQRERYKRDGLLSSTVKEFIDEVCQPLKEYEVVFAVEGLELRGDCVDFWGSVLIKLSDGLINEANLSFSNFHKHMIGYDLKSAFENKAGILVREMGNNRSFVAARVRERAQVLLKTLQAYLKEGFGRQEEDLLFELSELYVMRETAGPFRWLGGWDRKRRPGKLILSDPVKGCIEQAKDHFNFLGKMDVSLRKKVEIALYWTGQAVKEDIFSFKILYLCTAMESLLTTIDDKRKGEALVYRMTVVNHIVEGAFPNPEMLLSFYEDRSKVVHGAALVDVAYSSCSSMFYAERMTRHNFFAICKRFDVKTYKEFLAVIHKTTFLDPVREYFEKQGRWASDILSAMPK